MTDILHRSGRSTAPATLALALLLAAGAAGCRRTAPAGEDGLRIVASIPALGSVVRLLLGPETPVHVLLPSGTSPHAYEPRPSDLRVLSHADLLVLAGPGVDDWAAPLTDGPVIELFASVPDSLRLEVAGRPDPHFWLDPILVAAILPDLADALCATDRIPCPGLRERSMEAQRTLYRLADSVGVRLDSLPGSGVVVSGPFLTYFAHRFRIPVAGVIEESEGVEPSAARLRRIMDTARDAAAVVGQPWLPEEPARAVAEAAGIPYVAVDPVGNPGTTPDYAAFVTAIADSLLRHLPR